MFVGHLAVSLAAKAIEPKAPLSALVPTTFGLDLIWPIFVLLDVEIVAIVPGITAFTPLDFLFYPWSHSLIMAVMWGAVAAGFMYGPRRSLRVAFLVGAVVVSHWFLDFVTHRPDLPLWPEGPKLGLGLWYSIPGTLIVEGGLFLSAIVIYTRAWKPLDAIGKWAFRGVVGFTGLIWITQPWSTTPPSSSAMATVALAMIIFPWWAAWIDRHRSGVQTVSN